MTKKFNLLFILLTSISRIGLADVIESKPVGPGVIHYHEFRQAGPWHLHVLEIDLTNEWIKMEAVTAGDLLIGNERTSSMAARKNREAHKVISAINADFYGELGVPIGVEVIDGILIKQPYSRSVFGYTQAGLPLIDIVSFNGSLETSDNTSLSINGVNRTRGTNELIVFNKYFGTSTGANYWGTEIVAEYISDPLSVNDTIYVRVVEKDSTSENGHGDNSIPANGVVFSGHGTSRDFLDQHIFIGDTISFVLALPPITKSITQMVGGTPRLIRNGVATVEWAAESIGSAFSYDRHPRTAVGFNQDSTKLYLFTVDGRQAGYSVGMSLYELADYMLEWYVYQGVNLDGGGSTTMVVRGNVVNSPSDAGGERAVANALMCVCTAPTGSLAILNISPAEVYVLTENTFQLSVSGFDQYYNSVSINRDSLYWGCDPKIGTINENGLLTAGGNEDSGYVFVSFGDIKDSALVHVTKVAFIELSPNPLVIRIGDYLSMGFEVRDAFGNPVTLARNALTWSVSGDFGTISSYGFFRATQSGQGYIIACYEAAAGSSAVFVGENSDIVLDDFGSTSNWSISGLRINLNQCNLTIDNSVFISPPTSGKLDYSLTTGGTSTLYLDCSIPITGSPDAIGIYVYGDGKEHWLRGELEDADSEKFLVNFTESDTGINWTNSWKYLKVEIENAITHWGNPSAFLDFPITWKRIYLAETSEHKKDAGTLYFDDFTAHYISTAVDENLNTKIPTKFELAQNSPNPFNPTTKISFCLPDSRHVKLTVFNTLGEQVASLVNAEMTAGQHSVNFDAKRLASGIYLYRIDTGDFTQAKKMYIIK